MKTCTKCNEKKPLEEFVKKRANKDGHASACRVCSRRMIRGHYRANRKYYRDKGQRYNEKAIPELRAKMRTLLENSGGCVDCGFDNIMALHFDHKDPATKEHNISQMMSRIRPWKVIKKEIDKCDIRCANCHAIRTAEQFGYWKSTVPS